MFTTIVTTSLSGNQLFTTFGSESVSDYISLSGVIANTNYGLLTSNINVKLVGNQLSVYFGSETTSQEITLGISGQHVNTRVSSPQ